MNLINDLRQGNYIKCDGDVYQMKTKGFIDHVDKRVKKFITKMAEPSSATIEITDPNFDINRLEGIPIEEIVSSFDDISNPDIFFDGIETPNSIAEKYDLGKGHYMKKHPGYWLIDENQKHPFFYLHELQNSYFDITNDYLNMAEWEIKTSLRYNPLGVDIRELGDGIVMVTQSRLINGYILNQKQLIERGKEAFPGSKIIPVVYSLNVDDITLDWIETKMQEYGIKRNDLIKQLAIDRSSLSLIMSGKRELSKPMRATFFYYFLTYELNRDFREYLQSL